MSWNTYDDVQNDLLEYSDFADAAEDDFKPAPPKSIAEFRAKVNFQKNRSLFAAAYENDAAPIQPRGRGVPFNRDLNHRPDISNGTYGSSSRSDDANLARTIREVSGMGYSNELIEQSLGPRTPPEHMRPSRYAQGSDFTMPNLKLTSSPSSSSASSASNSPKRAPKVREKDLSLSYLISNKKVMNIRSDSDFPALK